MRAPIPVIYDTDIGTDIDDTWALGLLLASPELDLKLVVADTGDVLARAKIAARLLEVAGRTDVDVALGVPHPQDDPLPVGQAPWVEGYDLASYPGTVHEDGVQAMIDVIEASPTPVVLLAVGPVPNVAVLLERAPEIASKTRVVAMSGSVDMGYNGAPEPSPEYNVAAGVESAQAMYEAAWPLLIAPLDTAGQIKIRGPLYQSLLASESATVQAILDNYRIWEPTFQFGSYDVESESSVLFDALAVALVHDMALCEIDEIRLRVDDDGKTVRDPEARAVDVAMRWPDGGREAFEASLVERLLTLP